MKNRPAHPELITEIMRHCEKAGISKAEFGRREMGDPRFVYDLEAGRECRIATIAKVKSAISASAAA